jgi:antitoxin PrlF
MTDTYNLRSARIGNSAGFRLSAEFYRNHPQFANADGWIEVIAPDTAIVRIVPASSESEESEDDLILSLFLDFALKDSLKTNSLQPYTVEMSEAAHALIDGVIIDDNEVYLLNLDDEVGS